MGNKKNLRIIIYSFVSNYEWKIIQRGELLVIALFWDHLYR